MPCFLQTHVTSAVHVVVSWAGSALGAPFVFLLRSDLLQIARRPATMPCAGVNTPRSEAPLARRFRHTCVWAMSRGAWPRTLPATWTRSVRSGCTCIFLRGGTCRCAVGLQISTCNNDNMPSCRSRHAGALATLAWHDAVVHAQFNANCVSLVLVSLGACRSAAARTRRAAAADGRGTPGGGARSYLRAGAVAEFRVRRRPGTSRPRTCVRGLGRRRVNVAI